MQTQRWPLNLLCLMCHFTLSLTDILSNPFDEHVRSCVINETKTASYYANDEQIKVAHRRYRTREIKKFLIENATIIELQKDLGALDLSFFVELGPDSLKKSRCKRENRIEFGP